MVMARDNQTLFLDSLIYTTHGLLILLAQSLRLLGSLYFGPLAVGQRTVTIGASGERIDLHERRAMRTFAGFLLRLRSQEAPENLLFN
jgi:hypothetical protein